MSVIGASVILGLEASIRSDGAPSLGDLGDLLRSVPSWLSLAGSAHAWTVSAAAALCLVCLVSDLRTGLSRSAYQTRCAVNLPRIACNAETIRGHRRAFRDESLLPPLVSSCFLPGLTRAMVFCESSCRRVGFRAFNRRRRFCHCGYPKHAIKELLEMLMSVLYCWWLSQVSRERTGQVHRQVFQDAGLFHGTPLRLLRGRLRIR